jgi:hypothetical protein
MLSTSILNLMSHGVSVEGKLSKEEVADSQVPGSALAGFLELRGRQIVKGCDALWYTVRGRFLMSVPYERMLDPQPEELRSLMRDTGTLGVRFPSLIWSGLQSGLYILRPRRYDIGSIHIKHRPRVRHAMQHFEFRLAEKSELMDQGRELNLNTMARQGRYDPEFGEPRWWERLVEAAFTCPGVSIPAVFSGSRLAAYMVTCREQKWFHILHQMSRQEDLPNYPNHLLTYAVTAQAAADAALETVCYGYVPLFAADGLHEYKLRFGYELIPHRSAIQLHPALKAVTDHPALQTAVRLAERLLRGDQRLETIETVLLGSRLSGRG